MPTAFVEEVFSRGDADKESTSTYLRSSAPKFNACGEWFVRCGPLSLSNVL